MVVIDTIGFINTIENIGTLVFIVGVVVAAIGSLEALVAMDDMNVNGVRRVVVAGVCRPCPFSGTGACQPRHSAWTASRTVRKGGIHGGCAAEVRNEELSGDGHYMRLVRT